MLQFKQTRVTHSFYNPLIICFLFLLFSFYSFSQNEIDSINLQKIPQKHKYKFIHNKYLENISTLDNLHPECYDYSDLKNFHFQEDSFIIKQNINAVWKEYKTISLKDGYCGKIVKLGFVYSKNKKKIFYINDKFVRINEGQVYFIRLNILGGIKKLIVAYEVTKIDDKIKMIQFCYINNGISEGSQRIYLYKTSDGFTKIKHKTFYKSNSKFRDQWLYPVFHRRVIAELHHNLMKAIALSNKNQITQN